MKQTREEPEFNVHERMHPLARDAYYLLHHMNDASRRTVYQALASIFLHATPCSERETAATASLLAAMESLGTSELSAGAYRSWRSATRNRREFMSESTIRRVFEGSWTRAIATVNATPLTRFQAIRRRSLGARYSDEDVQRILEMWADETDGNISEPRYSQWAEQKIQSGVRVPRAYPTIRQRYVSTRAMHEAAGLVPDPSLRARSYSRDEMIEVVRRANEEVPGLLSAQNFSSWRNELKALGETVPACNTIARELGGGSWTAAREAVLTQSPDSTGGGQ